MLENQTSLSKKIECTYNLANRFYHINLVSNTIDANSSTNPKASEIAILFQQLFLVKIYQYMIIHNGKFTIENV